MTEGPIRMEAYTQFGQEPKSYMELDISVFLISTQVLLIDGASYWNKTKFCQLNQGSLTLKRAIT
jgi:hypothetical protein